MNPKHTPGPWEVSKPCYFEEGGELSFSKGQGYTMVGQEGEMYDHAIILCQRGNDEGLANARLIAAAPTLLKACEAVFAKLDYLQALWSKEGVTNSVCEQVREAIKLAQGQ